MKEGSNGLECRLVTASTANWDRIDRDRVLLGAVRVGDRSRSARMGWVFGTRPSIRLGTPPVSAFRCAAALGALCLCVRLVPE